MQGYRRKWFFADIAMGIVTILFNRQVLYYLGLDALAVYGVITQIVATVQGASYCIGQAAQPLISVNYGAAKWSRIKETLKYALLTSFFFGLFWIALICLFPNVFVQIFMQPTAEVLAIAPNIIRIYAVSFLFLPFNIFATYYFQSILEPKTSFAFSIVRGLILSSFFIVILPRLFTPSAIWLTMPCTEIIITIASIYFIKHFTIKLGQ